MLTASNEFRDYNTTGVPASGIYRPRKDKIRELLAQYESGISSLYVSSVQSGMQLNGSMDVSQENGSNAVNFPTGTQSAYVIDGWRFQKGGTSEFNVQQVASVFPGFQKALKLTVTTAQASMGTDNVHWRHYVEGYVFARANWGTGAAVPVTVGFWVKASVTGTISIVAINAAETTAIAASVAVTAANTPQWVTATFPAQTGGTWNTTNGTGMKVVATIAAAGQMNIVSTIGNTYEMTGFVMMPGSDVPPPDRAPLIVRPFPSELLLCRRYFYQSIPPARGVVQTTSVAGRLSCLHPIAMRATPTVTMLNSPGSAYPGVYDGTVFPAAASINLNTTTDVLFEVDLTMSAATLTVGRAACLFQGNGSFKIDARMA